MYSALNTLLKMAFSALAAVVFVFALHSHANAQEENEEASEKMWRFVELERLIYYEEAEKNLLRASEELERTYQIAERRFRTSGVDRLQQFGCPEASSLAMLEEHVDPNVTTARLYLKYGKYFLCIRQYDGAIASISKSIPLFRNGYGREALIERTDPNYLAEVRQFYDDALFEAMSILEAAGAYNSFHKASLLHDDYWPNRFAADNAVMMMRGNVIDAWEEAVQLLLAVGLTSEANEATEELRAVLTFDQVAEGQAVAAQ